MVQTYSNKDIMTNARVLTGFVYTARRGNVEELFRSNKSRMDPMRIEVDSHDYFPKTSVDGNWIGDRYPLCVDLPQHHFLKIGATFRFRGGSSMPQSHYAPGEFFFLCNHSVFLCKPSIFSRSLSCLAYLQGIGIQMNRSGGSIFLLSQTCTRNCAILMRVATANLRTLYTLTRIFLVTGENAEWTILSWFKFFLGCSMSTSGSPVCTFPFTTMQRRLSLVFLQMFQASVEGTLMRCVRTRKLPPLRGHAVILTQQMSLSTITKWSITVKEPSLFRMRFNVLPTAVVSVTPMA